MSATELRSCPSPTLSWLLLSLAVAAPASAAGNPDPTFSGDGRATVAFSHAGVRADAVAFDHNLIVVAGTTTTGDDDFVVARLTSSGGLDNGFGLFGRASIAFDLGGTKDDRLHEVAVVAGGKIALIGGAKTATSESLAVARLLSSGEPDTLFGHGGKRTVGHPQWPTGVLSVSVAIVQPDGKFLFGGSCRNCPEGSEVNSNPFIARLLATGALDTTFGDGGWLVGPWLATEPGLIPDQDDSVADLAVDASGRIVAQVKSIDMTGAVQVARFLADGTLDTSWNGDGVAVILNDPISGALGVAVDPASGAVYSAYWYVDGARVCKFLPSGYTDTGFAYYGTYKFAAGATVADLLVDSSGRLVAVGHKSGERFWLGRLLANGTPDSSFGSGGFAEVEFDLTPSGDDRGRAAAFSGTKLVTVGSAPSSSGLESFAVLRTD